MRLLLGSGGLSSEARREVWRREVDDFLGPVGHVLFVPYALADHDRYVAKLEELRLTAGRTVRSLHREPDPRRAVIAFRIWARTMFGVKATLTEAAREVGRRFGGPLS